MSARLQLILLAVLGLALGNALAIGAAPASAEPVSITEAPALTWGFKHSWRFYVSQPAVSGGAAIVSEATPAAHNLTWQFASGTYDATDGTTVLRYKGTAHWTKYNYLQNPNVGTPPPSYSGSLDVDLLDVTVTDPVVTISRDTATISAQATSRQLSTWQLNDVGRVDLATLDIGGLTPTVAGGTTTWSAIPAATNPTSTAVFGGNYLPGIAIDAVSFSYTGPGGAPDLSESFDAPGTTKLDLTANEIVVPSGTTGDTYTLWWVDRTYRIAHYRTANSSGGGSDWIYQAFDLDTMQKVGTPLVTGDDLGQALLVDTTDGRAFTQNPAQPDLRHWIRFDRDTGTYERGELAAPIPTPTFGGQLSWDPVGRRAFEVVQTVPDGVDPFDFDHLQWQLLTYAEQSDATWTKTAYALPGFGAGLNAVGYQPLGAAASDGSLIIPGDLRYAYPETPGVVAPTHVPGTFRIVTHGDGTATTEAVAGTDVPNDFGATFGAIAAGPGGLVALHRGNQGVPALVQTVDVTPAGGGAIVADPAVDLGTFDGSGLGNEEKIAFDPEDGTVWLSGVRSQRIVGVRDGKLVANQFFDKLNPRTGVLVAGPDHTLFAQTSDGEPTPFGGYPAFGFGKLDRLGVSPEVTTDPDDASVMLGAGDTSADVTFTAGADATPAPALQWQVRAPGASRFANLVGETDPTLTVSARRGLGGSQYRAVFSNVAGKAATAVATLTVRFAPRVTFDPLDTKVVEGGAATFELLGDGSPEPTVTWQRRVGGFWQTITDDVDTITFDSSSLTVKDTNIEQSGALFRAKLVNAAGTTYSKTAKLTVSAKATPAAGELDGISLDWTGNAELQKAPPFGGSNYFSAGVSDGDEATYSARSGSVQIFQVSAGGDAAAATWTTRAGHVTGGGRQLVRLHDGHAQFAADGSATVAFNGAFTVNFYGGLNPFSLTNPQLTVAADGTGTLKADLSGYASSQANPNERTPLAPVSDVTVATFSGVEIDRDGKVTIDPDYAGVAVTVPAGTTPQNRTVADWGGWPQPFVDFQAKTGLSSYWYSSGGAADAAKPPAPFVVDFSGATVPQDDPEPAPEVPTLPAPQAPARPQAPPVDAQSVPKAPATPVTIAPLTGTHRIDALRRVALATLTCPAGGPACAVTAPKRVTVRIAGKSYSLPVLAPKSIAAGKKATLRVQLSKAAASRLKGRSARLTIKVTIIRQGTKATRTVTVTVRPARGRPGVWIVA